MDETREKSSEKFYMELNIKMIVWKIPSMPHSQNVPCGYIDKQQKFFIIPDVLQNGNIAYGLLNNENKLLAVANSVEQLKVIAEDVNNHHKYQDSIDEYKQNRVSLDERFNNNNN